MMSNTHTKYEIPKINIKKLWGNDKSKEENKAEVMLIFKKINPFAMYFAIQVTVYDKNGATNIVDHNDFDTIYSIDKINKITYMQYIKEMYDNYNQKSIHFGTNLQEDILKEAYANGELEDINDVKECKKYLTSIDMAETTIDGKTYPYGYGFIDNKPVEEGTIEKITWLMRQPDRILKA